MDRVRFLSNKLKGGRFDDSRIISEWFSSL